MNRSVRQRLHWSSWLLVLIVLLGAWLRLEATLHTQVQTPIRADALDYYSYGYNLRHHGVYSKEPLFAQPDGAVVARPDALRSPGYPLFLTFFADGIPTQKTIIDVTLAQAVLSILVIPLTFLMSRTFMKSAWATVPALLVAISPQLINANVYMLSEALFIFLLMAAVGCMAVQFNQPNRRWMALFGGLLLGAAALTRPTLNYLLLFLMPAMLPLLPRGVRWSWASATVVGFAVAILPWMMRNWVELGGGDPTLAINTLVHGHYPGAMFDGAPESLGIPYRFDPQIEQLSASMWAAVHGVAARIMADPATYLAWYLFGKPAMFLSWGDVASWGDIFTYPTPISPYHSNLFFLIQKLVMHATHYLWVALATFGCLVALSRWRAGVQEDNKLLIQRLLVTVFLYFIAIHMIGFPIARYCIPVLPIIFTLATYTLSRLVHSIVLHNQEYRGIFHR